MIIPNTRTVRTLDQSAYSWAGLRKFQNVDLITDELMALHQVPERWRHDVKKQAQQLRYCLTQAREYFAAAQAVSLATKPNLLYYGTMCLALAEILFKQTGDSSLDKARAEHRHHGLTVSVGGVPRGADLATSSASLRAVPMEIDGNRKGTFELWHRTSREHPLGGKQTVHFENAGTNTSYVPLLGAVDQRYPAVPGNGVTLKDCLCGLPSMFYYCANAGLGMQLVRGRVEKEVWPGPNWKEKLAIIFHPSPLNAALLETVLVDPNRISQIEIMEVNTGYVVNLWQDWINGRFPIPLPPAAMIDPNEWRMWTNTPSLNEFGYFYAGLFIAGNYARYYPDYWLDDIERSTPLALAIEELCTLAEWRVPWLSLCELGRNLLVNEH